MRSFKLITFFTSLSQEVKIDLLNIEGLDPREVIKIEITPSFGGIKITCETSTRPKHIWKPIFNVISIGMDFSNGDCSSSDDLSRLSKCVFFRDRD